MNSIWIPLFAPGLLHVKEHLIFDLFVCPLFTALFLKTTARKISFKPFRGNDCLEIRRRGAKILGSVVSQLSGTLFTSARIPAGLYSQSTRGYLVHRQSMY